MPEQLKGIMQKAKCPYAFVVPGDLWLRSKENLHKINSRKKYNHNLAGNDWVQLSYSTSYMTWMVFDLNNDSLILWNLEMVMPETKEEMIKQFKKLFKKSFK